MNYLLTSVLAGAYGINGSLILSTNMTKVETRSVVMCSAPGEYDGL